MLTDWQVTNTDDFLIRMLKGCVQLGSRPFIGNTINMVPADHVARTVVACALHPPATPLGVAHVTSQPRLRFNQFLAMLDFYGYRVKECEYDAWCAKLEKYVSDGPIEKDYEQHALCVIIFPLVRFDVELICYARMPLYHFVTSELPANTKASELDDRNAVESLKADAEWTGEDRSSGSAVSRETIGKYLRYLTLTGFLKAPEGKGARLPDIALANGQEVKAGIVGGRGGTV